MAQASMHRLTESGVRPIGTWSRPGEVARAARIGPIGGASPALPSASGRRAAGTCRGWCEAYVVLDMRVRAAHILSMHVRGAEARAEIDWWFADLDAISLALYDLHERAVDPDVRAWIRRGSALVAYVSAAYVWCGDLAVDLSDLFGDLHRGTWRLRVRRAAFIDESSAYVATFLEPLFCDLRALCGADSVADDPLAGISRSAQLLQSAIVEMDWALRR
jgi:hypothetical protein